MSQGKKLEKRKDERHTAGRERTRFEGEIPQGDPKGVRS